MARSALALAAVVCIHLPIALGIVGLKDVPISDYVVDDESRYSCAFTYDPEEGDIKDCGCSCGASMIKENWAISAAHCFTEGPEKLEGKKLMINGEYHEVEKVVVHPCGPIATKLIDKGNANVNNKDIALIKFKNNVNVVPCEMWPGEYGSELQKTAYLVGKGVHGVAEDRDEELKCDHKLHRGVNKVESVEHSMLKMIFHAQKDSARDSEGNLLEAIAGDGDSGGPLIIKENGKMYIAGVSSFGDPSGALPMMSRFKTAPSTQDEIHSVSHHLHRHQRALEGVFKPAQNLNMSRNATLAVNSSLHIVGATTGATVRRCGRRLRRRQFRRSALSAVGGDVWGYSSVDEYAAVSIVKEWINNVIAGVDPGQCHDF